MFCKETAMKTNSDKSYTKEQMQYALDRLAHEASWWLGIVSVSSSPLTAAFNEIGKRRVLNKITEKLAPLLAADVKHGDSLEKKLVKLAAAAQEQGYEMSSWSSPLPQVQAIVQEAEKSNAGRWKTLRITHQYLQKRKTS